MPTAVKFAGSDPFLVGGAADGLRLNNAHVGGK